MSVAESAFRYEDLFDIENRPGAGVRLWGKAVEEQIQRVVASGNQHRQNNAPDGLRIPAGERLKHDPDAERRLHTEVYFLALAIRRVLLFHEAIARQVSDARLFQARATFTASAPEAKDFRDFFEHLDEYLLGSGRAQREGRIVGRISPILRLRWGEANVIVDFGGATLDVTAAGEAAVKLADATAAIWEEFRDQAPKDPSESPPDDGVPHMLEVTTSTSTVIGGEDEGHVVTTGILLRVGVRPASPDEIKPSSSAEE